MDKSSIHDVILVVGSTRIPKACILSGGTINGAVGDMVLLDVTPLSLGVEVGLHSTMSVVIPRNTAIPTKQTKRFTTLNDNQVSCSIRVYEGKCASTKDNNWLGTFVLSGIRPAPRGVPAILVTFDIDVNGVMNVTAEDRGTGRKSSNIITSHTGRLRKEEIERTVREAEKHNGKGMTKSVKAKPALLALEV
ncbi:Heat shock cognate 70 kDa protein [Dichanthelium oligosanthes]|uniref:Heat shock cognate 70 kDa protein n=1 Tax=Dichanthelium oligosanthes TaxID=888268 RepID=A0A1E5W9E1_9POAL|nr:Heat shock cognate 70 kDa protein [Dichanthelium oligosanthes]